MSTVYATAADLLVRYDRRMVADLISDSGLSDPNPTTSAVVSAALADASAEIDRAALYGKRYTLDDLALLGTAEDPTLKRMACDLAMGLLYARRGRGVPDGHQEMIDATRDALEDLRAGRHILPLDPQINAQTVSVYRPSRTELRRLDPFATSPIYPDATRYVGGA